MLFKKNTAARGLSVVAVFFNMRREAEQTLYTLTRSYQQLGDETGYEVMVIDNGSSKPLDSSSIESFGADFRYHYAEADSPSPCAAINRFVSEARFEHVMVLIDGARMLSPGVIRWTMLALELFQHPFVYTIGMHLGPKPQNFLVSEGYGRADEDQLLQRADWKNNGYNLFKISTTALSSKQGFFSAPTESNCFALRKTDFIRAGLYRTQFRSRGGGLCNLEIFNRIHETQWIQPVMLLGEATFHQFHGGVATNVPMSQHPWQSMQKEYAGIVGEPWRNKSRPPTYLGSFRKECAPLYDPTAAAEPK